jgi:putative redox protein
MNIVVKNVEGITFLGRGKTNHWVVMDGSKMFGGSEAASSPMELFLMSLAGCSGADVASLMKKMRVPYNKFEIHVEAERAEEHPKVYTQINMYYKFWGDSLEEYKDKIEKSIHLSQEKYCSVSAMIKAANIPLNFTFELKKSK